MISMRPVLTQQRTARLIALGAFVLTAAFFFHQVLFMGKTFIARDHYLFFLPRRFFALNTLLDGSLPLWNPLNACGVPFLANVQSSVFYPLSAIVYILPFPLGYSAFVIVHYVLAAFFMYALMRHWSSSPFASTLAGLVFAFGGYMQSINDNVAFLTSATWLPLIMLCFSQALQHRARLWIIATMLLIGVQVLAGDASFCVLSTLLCTGLYALCAPRGVAPVVFRIRAVRFCAVWMVGLLLAAIVLLPFLEYVSLSDRAAGLAPEEALRWSLHPLELLQFVQPYLFGRLVPDVRWFGQRWLDTAYIGIFPLCFSALYLLRCRCERKLFTTLLVLLGLLLALGAYNPVLSYLIQKLPGLRLMQYPVKFLLLCAFGLAVMSGRGVDEFLTRMRARSSIRGILKPLLLPVCVLLALLLAGAAGRDLLFNLFCRVYPATDYFTPLRETCFFEIYRGIFFTALLFGAFAALSWCAIRFSYMRGLLCILTGGIVCADLLLLGAPGDPWLERRDVLRPDPVVQSLQQDESIYRIYSLSRIAGSATYAHTPHLSFDRVYRVLSRSLPPNLHMYHGLASVDEYAEMLNMRHYELFAPVLLHLAGITEVPDGSEYSRKIFSLLNVKYIISPKALPELRFELLQDGPLKIYRNADVRPRAYLAAPLTICPDDAAVRKRIREGAHGPRAVFVTQAEMDRLPPDLRFAVAAALPEQADTAARITHYTANRVEITVDSVSHALLVLSDTWFPGWRALVNGAEQPLLRVNHTLRGVALEPGERRVEFVYRPQSFTAGLILSMATLLAVLATALWHLRRRTHPPHGDTAL
jgi:hypothetical protein